jgi:hypothetical protein
MYKTKTAIAIGTLLLLGVTSTSHAADPATKQPLDQARESVDKNLAKDPDNKGLQNAAERLQTNQERLEKKRAEKEEMRKAKIAEKEAKRQAKTNKQAEKMPDHPKAERMEKMERPEKAVRPEKMDRPNR